MSIHRMYYLIHPFRRKPNRAATRLGARVKNQRVLVRTDVGSTALVEEGCRLSENSITKAARTAENSTAYSYGCLS
jgi:hypothetical protein